MAQQFFNFAGLEEDSGFPDTLDELSDLGAEIPSHQVMLASAGTGKTFQLSSRYLQLLAADQPVERILATTFTRKAAGEIFERVIERLARGTVDAKSRSELAGSIGLSELSADQCSALLARLTRQLHRMRIETLDAFFGVIARSYSFEMGLPPAWDIVEVAKDERLKERAVANTIDELGHSAMLSILDLVTQGDSSTAISRLILTDINDVYEQLYRPTELDDGSAWDAIPHEAQPTESEIDSAIESLEAYDGENFGHNSILKAHNSSIEFARNGDWGKLLTSGIPAAIAAGKEKYYGKQITEEHIAVYSGAVEVGRRDLVNKLRSRTQGAYELASAFSERYEKLKIDDESITFADVTHHLSRWNQELGLGQLEYRLGGTIDHLLLDEFQDTSATQWDCVQPFARSILGEDAKSKSFFCVGDIKQAIYGWRGGQPEILGTMEKRLGVPTSGLTASYRSSQVIIDVVNRVFSRLDQHKNLAKYEPAFKEWQEEFPVHVTNRDELTGYACLRAAPVVEKDADKEETKAAVLRFTAGIVHKIAEQSPQHNVGILFRSNESVSQMIFHLRELGVHASEEGKNPLTDSEGVMQILSLMNLADHPRDTLSAIHLSLGPIAEHLGLEWHKYPKTRHWQSAANVSRKVRRQLIVEGYDRCVGRWAKWLQPACSEREGRRLTQLVDLAYHYQPQSTLRPTDFVQFIRNHEMTDPSTAQVRVMTLHQSKGLEFDSVVLVPIGKDLMKPPKFAVQRNPETFRPEKIVRYIKEDSRKFLPGDLPKIFEEEQRRQIREYLCLEYVGLTRAKRALHIVVPGGVTAASKRPAGVYMAALAERAEPVDDDGFLFEAGDREWFEADSKKAQSSVPEVSPESGVRQVPVSLNIPKPAGATSRGRELVSPSQRTSKTQVHGNAFFSAAREAALERGTLIHAWMESVDWLTADVLPDARRLQQVAIALGSKLVDQKEALAEFHSIIRKPNIRSLLNEKEYADEIASWLSERGVTLSNRYRIEARNEQKIAVEEDGQVVSGEIDRLLLVHDGGEIVGADIVDYKTNRTDSPEDYIQLGEHYQPQLEAYSRAVTLAFGVDASRIRTRLFLLRADVAVDVDISS